MRIGEALAIAACLFSITALASSGCSSEKNSTPDSSGRSCEQILSDLSKAVTPEALRCETDDDCACFDSPHRKGECGVAVSKATNEDMVALTLEARRAGCRLPKKCPDWSCEPHCALGPTGEGSCTHVSPCAELSNEFAQTLEGGDISCEKNEDCGTYRAGVTSNCGGIIDMVTAKKLESISEEFFAQKCGYVVHCAPRMAFRPVCSNGKCVDQGAPGAIAPLD